MPELNEIENFLITARQKTYAGSQGETKPLLAGTKQWEFKEREYLYRDVYYTGKHTFAGLEAVYFQDKPVFSMSYYGNWGKMTETEIDQVLRQALLANPNTRLYTDIAWQKDDYTYECQSDPHGDLQEIGGSEVITKNDEQIYVFYYAGSVLI